MAEIRVPTLGESVTEATIGKWFKKAGDAVAVDEPLVELETDKVTIEVPAPAAGVLSEIAAKDGETVAVGAAARPDQGRRGRSPPKPRRGRPQRRPTAQARAGAAPRRHRAAAAAAAGDAADAPLAPSVRKLAAESGIDAGDGAGHRQGRPRHQGRHARRHRARRARSRRRSPAPAAAVQVRAPSPADDAAREERVRMTRLRQTIAARLKEAQNTAAMLTTFNEVDMSQSWRCARNTRICSRRSTA